MLSAITAAVLYAALGADPAQAGQMALFDALQSYGHERRRALNA